MSLLGLSLISPLKRPDLLLGLDLPALPKQGRSQKKREAILAAAQTLFEERGFEATTIEDIASHAEVAVGAFYQHFRAKRQILIVLMDNFLAVLESFQLQLDGAGTLKDQLHTLVLGALHIDDQYRGAYRAWREVMWHDEQIWAWNTQTELWTASRLALGFQAFLQLPGARPSVDVMATANLFNLLFWELNQRVGKHVPQDMALAITNMLYHTLFEG
jgi:AcrR family transcriptional regulator